MPTISADHSTRFLTMAEITSLYRVTRQQIRAAIEKGLLQEVVLGGDRVCRIYNPGWEIIAAAGRDPGWLAERAYWIPLREFAAICGVRRDTIQDRRHKKQIQGRMIGGRLHFSTFELRKVLEDRRRWMAHRTKNGAPLPPAFAQWLEKRLQLQHPAIEAAALGLNLNDREMAARARAQSKKS